MIPFAYSGKVTSRINAAEGHEGHDLYRDQAQILSSHTQHPQGNDGNDARALHDAIRYHAATGKPRPKST